MRKLIAVVFLGLFLSPALARDSLTVAFNTKSHKYHYASCSAAQRCTRNCVAMPLSEAIEAGGVPCKICKPPRK